MNRWLLRAAQVAVLATGGLLFFGAAAHAHSGPGHSNAYGNGTALSITLQAQLAIGGNSLAVGSYGHSHAARYTGVNATRFGYGGSWARSWDDGQPCARSRANANAFGHVRARGNAHARHAHVHNAGFGNGLLLSVNLQVP